MDKSNEARVENKDKHELWNGTLPYHYEKKDKAEYIKQEKDCDTRISLIMYSKSKQLWDDLQFYWF